MSCETFRSELIETARGAMPAPGFGAHLGQCSDCRRRLDLQVELTAAMARAASETASVCVPAGLERTLLAEFNRVRKPRNRPGLRWMAGAAAIAAGVTGAAIISGWWAKDRQGSELRPASLNSQIASPVAATAPTVTQTTPVVRVMARTTRRLPVAVSDHSSDALNSDAANEEQSFVPVPYTMPLTPGEPADLMRVEMPVAALIAAGMPVGATDPAAQARADVIVGQDGRARAYRVISVSSFNTGGSFGHE